MSLGFEFTMATNARPTEAKRRSDFLFFPQTVNGQHTVRYKGLRLEFLTDVFLKETRSSIHANSSQSLLLQSTPQY